MRAPTLGLLVVAVFSLLALVQCKALERAHQQPDAGPSAATTTTTSKDDPPCASIPCPPVGIAECDDYIAQATACFQKGDPQVLPMRKQLLAGMRNNWVEMARGWTPEKGGERDHAKARANAQASCKQVLALATKSGTFACGN
ncbi:MAG TPA: hypothetical protein VGG39_36760 [Polyangiaceae bacterium]|jgi:hypothetical protein